MTDSKPLVTDEMIGRANRARMENLRGKPLADREYRALRSQLEVDALTAAVEAVAPLIAAQAWDQGHRAAGLAWEHAYSGHTVEPGDASGTCTECGQGNPYTRKDS